MPADHPISTRLVAACAAVAVLLAACGGDDEPASAPTETTAPATSPPVTSSPVTTAATTTEAPATTAPVTAAPTTAAPPTTESCGAFCPLTDEQQAATDAFFATYNGDDWEAFMAVLATDEPTWEMTPSITQNTDLMRYDFIWSAALNEVWTPERCVDQYGTVSCSVVMEDDVHRVLAPYEMESSTCQLSFDVVDGKVLPKKYDALYGCHAMYDGAMHFFGAWFTENYPDLPPIHGVHYRGWNQTDETAGARAAEYLDEWAVQVAADLEGKTVDDVGGHP